MTTPIVYLQHSGQAPRVVEDLSELPEMRCAVAALWEAVQRAGAKGVWLLTEHGIVPDRRGTIGTQGEGI